MIPPRIHQIWCGAPAPENVQRWMETVRTIHPGWQYHLWNEEKLGDDGFAVASMHDELGSWASVSNALRILLLNKYGGVYLDADFECLRPIGSFLKYDACAALQDETRICNAFMGAEPRHPWIKWQIRHFADFDQRDPASGVYLATEAPRMGLTLIEPRFVYPFSYDTPIDQRRVGADSVLVHHWQKAWAAPC